MRNTVVVTGLSVLTLALSVSAPPASATNAAAIRSRGTFVGGSGSYLTTADGTDGLRQVSGQITFSQNKRGGTITVNGRLSGLEAHRLYVAVPYKDGSCIPLPGITAFPSGTFYTNRNGRAFISGVKVNPTAINPAGSFSVRDTQSASVRQAIVSSVALPGIPVGTPVVPNIVQPEACDKSPS